MILRDAIDHYVAWRRAHGARFVTSARALYQFCKGVPDQVSCDAVTETEVRQFLDGTGPLTRWRAGKYGALAGFYRYAISRGYASRSPLPAADEEPREPESRPPYIYSREELQRLFEAIDISRKHAIRLDGDTLRTLLLTLYGAGLRTSEALHLTMRDVDLATTVLTVRNTKFYKSSSRSRRRPACQCHAGLCRTTLAPSNAGRDRVSLLCESRRNRSKKTQRRSCV